MQTWGLPRLQPAPRLAHVLLVFVSPSSFWYVPVWDPGWGLKAQKDKLGSLNPKGCSRVSEMAREWENGVGGLCKVKPRIKAKELRWGDPGKP